MRYFFFDPGKTTGFVILNFNEDKKLDLIYADQREGFRWLNDFTIKHDDVICYERYFLPYNRSNKIKHKFDCSGIEFVGALQYVASIARCTLIRQEPSYATDFIPKRFAKQLEICGNNRIPIHAREAFFHALYYFKGNNDVLEFCFSWYQEINKKL